MQSRLMTGFCILFILIGEDYTSSLLVLISSGSRISIQNTNNQLLFSNFELLHKDSMPGYLAQFLSNPNFTFLGVGVEGDAEKLMCYHGLFVANTVDLNQLALLYYGEYVCGKMGLKRMAKALLGKVMEKPEDVTLSKWDAEDLSYEQVEYGDIDAFVSFEIGKELFNEISKREKELNCHYQPLNFHYQPWQLLQETRDVSKSCSVLNLK